MDFQGCEQIWVDALDQDIPLIKIQDPCWVRGLELAL